VTILDDPRALPGDAPRLSDVADDPSMLRKAFGHFPSGVAALCAMTLDGPAGMVASSFAVGASFTPAMVMFSVQESSTTWPRLRAAPWIGVSVLGVGHADIAMQLASRTADRFAGVRTMTSDHGSLFLEDAAALMCCELVSETPLGDHRIVVLQVHGMTVSRETEPLVYHGARFRRLHTDTQ
jgi:flavin reductase (DIM6/NTAB) family NADH-FMN oxidoreductase RutF